MGKKTGNLKMDISGWVMVYISGCFCFVLVAIASIWFGYYLISHYGEHNLPAYLIIFSLAGILLLWEMLKAFMFKATIPKSFRPVTEHEYPALFHIIAEVTTNLNLSPICRVYVCPDATAAVFIRPRLCDLLLKHERNLVIGMGFLTQMDDDEIRAILYHEFGHYVQEDMKNSVSVYAIGQFSRSFVSIKDMKKQGTWETQMKFQLLMFTYFTIWICDHINMDYSQLAKQMESDADDVAVIHVGAAVLQRTLLHAACIRYNYEVIQWGKERLHAHGIQVDNIYQALSLVGNYSRPPRRMFSVEVLRRVERLGELKNNVPLHSADTVRQHAMEMAALQMHIEQGCPAARFAQWLREGFVIYTEQRLQETAVMLEIHLDKRKHRLPYFDGAYRLLVDGKDIGSGNFTKGYTIKTRTSAGRHIMTAYAPSGIISTPFEFEVKPDRAYRIEMDYKVYLKDGVYDVFGEKIYAL